MEKIKKFIKKYDNVCIFFVFAVLLILPTFGLKLKLYDELWNFSNVLKMINGYTIYKDCNVIITPLFFYIGEVLLKVIGANFWGFRIYCILINSLLFTCVYSLFKSMHISKNKSFLYSLIILIISNEVTLWGANYNNLAIAFSIIGIILLIKNKNYLWQGIIIFLVFMCKQNIGVYYAIGITIARFWVKKDIKETIKETVINAITSGMLLSVYMLYLYINGSLYDFIDLILLGVSEFATRNISISISNVGIMTFQLVILIFMLIIITNKKIPLSKEIKDYLKIIFSVSTIFLLIEFPIFNSAHIMLSNILIIISYALMLEKTMLKDLFNKRKVINISLAICSVFFLAICVICILRDISEKFEFDKSSPYFGVKIDNETRDSMNAVCDYMRKNTENGKNTVIFSYKADLYLNIFKLCNNKFDLPFLGNLGSKGEDGLIEELDKMENTYILISKDDIFYQESEKALNYVKENFKSAGEIDNFYIYESHDM